MNIDFPFQFDRRGRTATTSDAGHVRDMIEQLLFTNPGERVNRPDFGSGLQQLVFAPNSTELRQRPTDALRSWSRLSKSEGCWSFLRQSTTRLLRLKSGSRMAPAGMSARLGPILMALTVTPSPKPARPLTQRSRA